MNSEKTFSAEFSLADSVTSCWLSYYAKTKGFLEQPGGSQHDILSLAKSVRSCLGDVEEVCVAFKQSHAYVTFMSFYII